MLVLPFAIGQAVQKGVRGCLNARKGAVAWLDRVVIGIAVYVAFSGAVEQGLGTRFGLGEWSALVALVCLFLALASGGAWLVGILLRQERRDRIAFLFGGAQKSVAIGAPLAAILFPVEAAGFVIAPLLLYHLLQLVIAAPLARRLSQG